MDVLITKTPKQTQALAKKIVKEVLASHHGRHAAVVALEGELGAGKTTFAQGFARALGIRGRVASPTFVLFRRYAIKKLVPERSRGTTLILKNNNVAPRQARGINYGVFYHVDAYRLQNPRELMPLGFKKILADPKNIVLVEWASKIKKILPRDTVWIKFYHGKNENEREVAFIVE